MKQTLFLCFFPLLMLACGSGVTGHDLTVETDVLSDISTDAAADVSVTDDFDVQVETVSDHGPEYAADAGGATDSIEDFDSADSTDYADDITSLDSTEDVADAVWPSPRCPDFGDVKFFDHINDERAESGLLAEVSGLASSRRQDSVLWAHEDSGARAYVAAINMSIDADQPGAVTFFELELPDGRKAVDWEDIASGFFPDDENASIIIADVGDNEQNREFVSIYFFDEPDTDSLSGDEGELEPVPVSVLDFKFEDGPRDCEAMFFDSDTGDLYFIEKVYEGTCESERYQDSDGCSGVYRLPRSAFFSLGPALPEAIKSGEVPLLSVTGADMSGDSSTLAVRGYFGSNLLYVKSSPAPVIYSDEPNINSLLTRTPCELPGFSGEPYNECQGEAIAFSRDGTRIFTVSEITDTFCDLPDEQKQRINVTHLEYAD